MREVGFGTLWGLCDGQMSLGLCRYKMAFHTTASSSLGGLWESAVKSIKFHSKRVIGNQVLSYIQMQTLLSQIEGCVNSRPLRPISTDAADPVPLTPGHFLIGRPITALPERNLPQTVTRTMYKTRWQLIQNMLFQF